MIFNLTLYSENFLQQEWFINENLEIKNDFIKNYLENKFKNIYNFQLLSLICIYTIIYSRWSFYNIQSINKDKILCWKNIKNIKNLFKTINFLDKL